MWAPTHQRPNIWLQLLSPVWRCGARCLVLSSNTLTVQKSGMRDSPNSWESNVWGANPSDYALLRRPLCVYELVLVPKAHTGGQAGTQVTPSAATVLYDHLLTYLRHGQTLFRRGHTPQAAASSSSWGHRALQPRCGSPAAASPAPSLSPWSHCCPCTASVCSWPPDSASCAPSDDSRNGRSCHRLCRRSSSWQSPGRQKCLSPVALARTQAPPDPFVPWAGSLCWLRWLLSPLCPWLQGETYHSPSTSPLRFPW